MRRLTPADYRRMPWRNGGGTTTEIVIAPEGASASGERFLYRVSIADVGSDGPFSRFDGYDRHIMLLSGAGMTLDCGAHGRVDLRTPFEPHAFSGDWDVAGALVDGPVRDFNLMVDRARSTATLEVKVLDERSPSAAISLTPRDVCIMHVIEGALEGADQGDTLVTNAPNAPFELRSRAGANGIARVAIARISERSRP